MPLGESVYHSDALNVLRATHAEGIVLLVIKGAKGSGISVLQPDRKPLSWLVDILRSIANEMEKDLKNPNGLIWNDARKTHAAT